MEDNSIRIIEITVNDVLISDNVFLQFSWSPALILSSEKTW